MRCLRFSVVVIAVSIFSLCSTRAQQTGATVQVAEVRVRNILVLPPRSLEFELVLTNHSSGAAPASAWRYWANGTFVLNAANINLVGAKLEVDSAGVPPERTTQASFVQGRFGYEILPFVQAGRGRLGVVILGADSVEHSLVLLPDSSLILGRFRLTLPDTLQTPERVRLAWALPLERLQANAFKHEQAQTMQGKGFNRNDNSEMLTSFVADAPTVERPPEVITTDLQAEYVGDKRVLVRWTTAEERIGRRTNAGFVLLRQRIPKPDGAEALGGFDTVATFLRSPSLRVHGSSNGTTYECLDSVQKRGDAYAYRLGFLDASVRPAQQFRAVFRQDTVQVTIPNAIIARADAAPNPFAETVRIGYTLLDRAHVTAWLYDAGGRLVREVFARAERPRGVYSFILDGSALPNQAAYFLVLTAQPVNDAAVERSQTMIKLQLSR